jgi:thiamine kinase-like enzyme
VPGASPTSISALVPGSHVLALEDVPGYLVDRGFLTRDELILRPLFAQALQRRNTIYRVALGDQSGVLLKQARSASTYRTLQREYETYRHLAGQPKRSNRGTIRSYMPRALGYDEERGILAIEYFPHARTFTEHHSPDRTIPRGPAERLGRALATLHAGSRLGGSHAEPNRTAFDDAHLGIAAKPWVLSDIAPPGLQLYESSSASSLQLLSALADYVAVLGSLRELGDRWSGDVMTHGDVKWDNLLLLPGSQSRTWTKVMLVDWERAGRAPAEWDIGSVFASYRWYWLVALSSVRGDSVQESLERSSVALEDAQPAMRAFWRGYCRARRLSPAVADQMLIDAIRFGSARVIQTIHEYLQQRPRVDTLSVNALQLAANMLERPNATIDLLLG